MARPAQEREAIEAKLGELICTREHCEVEWDPRICPECSRPAAELGLCAFCGHEWDPEACPACGGEEYRTESFEALLYPADGRECLSCEARWVPTNAETYEACPKCGGSTDLVDTYPEIPDLADRPDLTLLMAAEQRIPRAENGAILTRDMIAWLELHGIEDRRQMLVWERWFVIIGAIRGACERELLERKPAQAGDSERED